MKEQVESMVQAFKDLTPITLSVPAVNQSEYSLPAYATPGSAGLDLRATKEVSLGAGGRARVPTGLFLEIPKGFEGQVRSRSGLAIEKGLSVLNAPGTIDSDYRGEVAVILINHSGDPQVIKPGDRIAQLVLAPVAHAVLVPTERLNQTERGEGGFGSTGSQ